MWAQVCVCIDCSEFRRYILFIYLFIYRSRGRKGEREGEKHWCERETLIGCILYALSQGLTHSPGMCPDQEPNRWPLSLWEEVQPNEPHQSGPIQKLYGLWVKSHITSTHPPMVSGGDGLGNSRWELDLIKPSACPRNCFSLPPCSGPHCNCNEVSSYCECRTDCKEP